MERKKILIVRFFYHFFLLFTLSFCSLPSISRNPLEFFSLFRIFNTSSEYTLGGSVLGMVPGGSVTIKNAGEEITVTSDGNFIFSSRFPTGTSYAVSITPSSNMNCTLSNGSGTFQTANITTVAINCFWGSNFHELAVNVNGTAASFSVQNNGSDTLSISALGLQTFATRIQNGAAYDIRFLSQPSGAICSFDTPTLSRANMPNNSLTIQITCRTGNLVAGNLQVNVLSDIATNLYDRFAYVRSLVGAYPLNRPGGVGATSGVPNIGIASGNAVRLNNPKGIAFDFTHMYVADYSNNAIRKIDKTNGDTTHLAGSSVGAGVVCPGISVANCKDGIGLDAQFNGPVALTTDGNNLYVLESVGNRIRKVNLATADVSTLAGDGSPGSINSTTGINARFSSPSGITLRNQILYVVDRNNCTIRSVDTVTTEVTTIAGIPGNCTHNDNANGSLATFTSPLAAVAYGNYLYVTDVGGHRVRRINLVNGTFSVDTIAGSGTAATIDGIGTQASFFDPHGITTDGTTLFISEWVGQTIRAIRLSDFQVKTLAGDGTTGYEDNVRRSGRFNFPGSVTTDGNHLYIADDQNHSIRRLEEAEVLRYTLDGNSLDSIGTNHATTAIGTTTISSDEKGTASGSFVFDGATYLESATNINIDDHRNFTITAWVFPTSTSPTNQYIFFNGQGSTNGYGLQFQASTGRIRINLGPVGSSGYSARALPLNRWSHVALLRRDGNWQMYFNGQPETIIYATNPTPPIGNFKLGDSGTSDNFQGKISNVRFFQGALDNALMQALALQIPNGVVSYYAFNGNFNDFGGSGNQLTNSGSVSTADRYGHSNGAIFFNGVAFLQRASPNALPLGSSARTICAWFQTTSNANQSLISYGVNAAGQGVAIGYNGSNIGAIGIGADALGPHGGFENDWALACSVYDGTTALIYINGALYGSNTVTWNTSVGTDLFIGQDWLGGARFVGSIDELIIYNRALSQTELRALAGYYPTQVSSWSPTIASSSLKLYLKPEATTYSGGLCFGGTDCVSDWLDRSGNGIHLSQGLSTRQPFYSTLGMNNSKAVRFTRGATPAFMTGTCTETLNTASQSIFVTYSEIDLGPANNDGIFQNGSPSTGKLLYITRAAGNNPNLFDLQGGSTRLVSTSNYHNLLDNNLLTIIHNGTSGSLFRNGNSMPASFNAGGSYNCGGGQFHLGRYFYGGVPDGNYFDGFIGDVLIYNTALPSSDRIIVECYLSKRYRLPVIYTCP